MTFEQRKAGLVAHWLLVVTMTGIVLGIATPAGWGFIAAIAVIPAIVTMRLWTAASPSSA